MGQHDSDWRRGFHRALVDAIVRNGSPHDPGKDGYYGSSLPDNSVEIGPRVATVGIDYNNTPTPVEADWTEFGGTFDEDQRKYGVDLNLLLLDGTRVWYRYDGTISTLIRAVVAVEPCAGSGQRWIKDVGNRRCPVCRSTARVLGRISGKPLLAYQVPTHPAKEA
jgi:hypothetical protein